MIKNEITQNNSPEGVEDGDVVKAVHYNSRLILPFLNTNISILHSCMLHSFIHTFMHVLTTFPVQILVQSFNLILWKLNLTLPAIVAKRSFLYFNF
jgi:hypothetical protein